MRSPSIYVSSIAEPYHKTECTEEDTTIVNSVRANSSNLEIVVFHKQGGQNPRHYYDACRGQQQKGHSIAVEVELTFSKLLLYT
jgi:hypothetical protein